MAKDIEEFLRRAAERKRQQQSGQGQQRPASPAPQRPSPSNPPMMRPARQSRASEPIIIEDVEIVEARPANLRQQSVEEHVRQHIDTSDIREKAASLGQRIHGIAEQTESRIHEHLDHDLTEIDDRPTITDDPPPKIFGKSNNPMTQELRKMLANPKEIGKAIFVSEILKRPDWD